MEVILLQDIEKVGKKFEVVKVRDGYGRNYLIPKGMALLANKSNMRRLEEYRRREEAQMRRLLEEAKQLASQLEDKVLKIGAKVGTSGKIFGSITNLQVANALKEQLGIEVDRRKIEMPEEVKEVGVYTAVLKIHPEVDTRVSFEVVAE
ncbi:MAG: 50S ribosomal protein L9 [Bacteroidetes bacterium]|nr:MAG: 50S ribosomal protein L9 [Bacteroidota bacterium]